MRYAVFWPVLVLGLGLVAPLSPFCSLWAEEAAGNGDSGGSGGEDGATDDAKKEDEAKKDKDGPVKDEKGVSLCRAYLENCADPAAAKALEEAKIDRASCQLHAKEGEKLCDVEDAAAKKDSKDEKGDETASEEKKEAEGDDVAGHEGGVKSFGMDDAHGEHVAGAEAASEEASASHEASSADAVEASSDGKDRNMFGEEEQLPENAHLTAGETSCASGQLFVPGSGCTNRADLPAGVVASDQDRVDAAQSTLARSKNAIVQLEDGRQGWMALNRKTGRHEFVSIDNLSKGVPVGSHPNDLGGRFGDFRGAAGNLGNHIHEGRDFMCQPGYCPVYASTNGTIVAIGRGSGNTGNRIWILSDDGTLKEGTFHMSYFNPELTNGTRVQVGDYLGEGGNSGAPWSDYHKHFELRLNMGGRYVARDPGNVMSWLYPTQNELIAAVQGISPKSVDPNTFQYRPVFAQNVPAGADNGVMAPGINTLTGGILNANAYAYPGGLGQYFGLFGNASSGGLYSAPFPAINPLSGAGGAAGNLAAPPLVAGNLPAPPVVGSNPPAVVTVKPSGTASASTPAVKVPAVAGTAPAAAVKVPAIAVQKISGTYRVRGADLMLLGLKTKADIARFCAEPSAERYTLNKELARALCSR